MDLAGCNHDELLQQLFHAAPDALVLCDMQGRIALVNEQALLTFGYSREELVGRPVEVLIPERYRHDHPRHRAQFVLNPGKRPMGLWRSLNARHKFGGEVPVEVCLSRIAATGAHFVLAAIRDVTERQTMESMIQGSNITLEQIAKGAPLAEVLATMLELVEQNNSKLRCAVLRRDTAAHGLLVKSAPSLPANICQHIRRNPINPDLDLWSEAIYQGERIVLTDVQTPFAAELAPLANELGVKACWSEPIVDSLGHVLGAFVAFCDESREPRPLEAEQLSFAAHLASIGLERDLSNKQLLVQQEQLRHKHKLEAVGSLAGGIAHEFNNLLQVICAYSDFSLKELPPDSPVQQDMLTVRSAARRARSLTRQLLSFCRQQPLEQRLFDPNVLVAETVELLKPLIGEQIELLVECSDTVPCAVGDVGQLQQVLTNLCINARDAMPNGGRLLIATQMRRSATTAAQRTDAADAVAEQLVLIVQDTGSGMTPEVKARIFEPFFTTKEPGQGTGLGLSMVYGIVEQHGGSIEVDSTPRVGTTVRVALPAANSKEAGTCKDRPSDDGASQPRGDGRVILVVEDDEAVRHALERILLGAGFTVLSAGNGGDALDLLNQRRNRPSLAMIDMVMPGQSGREVAVKIRQLYPAIPIVFCTGYDPDHALSLDELANVRTLVKPVDAEHLLRVVNESLEPVASASDGPAGVRLDGVLHTLSGLSPLDVGRTPLGNA